LVPRCEKGVETVRYQKPGVRKNYNVEIDASEAFETYYEEAPHEAASRKQVDNELLDEATEALNKFYNKLSRRGKPSVRTFRGNEAYGA
jgi:hypothetical protein